MLCDSNIIFALRWNELITFHFQWGEVNLEYTRIQSLSCFDDIDR